MASFETDTVHIDNYSRQGSTHVERNVATHPRLVVARLIRRYPKKTKDEIIEAFAALCEKDSELNSACVEYTGVNMYQAEFRLLGSGPNPNPPPKPEEKRAAAEKRAEEMKAKILGVLTLEFVMPNGQHLRDCTGAQCTEAGGQFAAIGSKVGPKRKVGEVIRDDRALAAVLKKP